MKLIKLMVIFTVLAGYGYVNANPILDFLSVLEDLITCIFNLIYELRFKLTTFGSKTVVLNTTLGLIRGIKTTTKFGETYVRFNGVRFAQPAKRFELPANATKWSGIYDATKESKMCYQTLADFTSMFEDCLFLSISVPPACMPCPSDPTKPKCPVLVFYYGGANFLGSNHKVQYAPDNLIREGGVIIVQPNYRLGVFGFLSDPCGKIPKNIALHDVIAAMIWVHENIADYGGDPLKVTANGQSAGAALVSYMMHSPRVSGKGLFQRAILQSSNILSPWGYKSNPTNVFNAVVASTPICGTLKFIKVADAVECVKKTLAVDLLVGSTINVVTSFVLSYGLFSGVDLAMVHEDPSNPNAAYTTYSHQELVSGNFPTDVEILTGTNSEEAILFQFVIYLVNILNLFNENALVPENMHATAENKKIVGRKILDRYFGGNKFGMLPPNNILPYASDVIFNIPNREYIRLLLTKNVTLYCYQYSYASTAFSTTAALSLLSPNVEVGKASHGDEMLHLWYSVILGQEAFTDSTNTTSEGDLHMKKVMPRLWLNFVKGGNPTPIPDDPLLNNHTWKRANVEGLPENVTCTNIDLTLTTMYNPKDSGYQWWRQMYSTYGAPKDTY